ncbi:allantoate amidohydrolase [Frigoribacterium sp. Leaf172]|uniref:allantoate amidohydrolase n=1 Tax=Frigoribacterium sp. Leaf172 TaxID=1736285 RepID=UPI0009E7C550|nr:allantoate amidohydrolase [Frigoribacterium sp. Leaf172]
MALARSGATVERTRLRTSFDGVWGDLEGVGRDPRSGGYDRFSWTGVDLGLREWFAAEATRRGLEVEVDRNGNQWAWWGAPADGAVVTGSHLDSVPGGGAFDGPLGVVSALLAVDALRAAGVVPARPLAVVNFVEEEGARFGLACLGSRLMTGAVDAGHALSLTDDDGTTLADAMSAAGHAPEHVGLDEAALARIGVFVELHVEQGRHLALGDESVGVASSILPHGRWHFCFEGEGNHAGTTRLVDRHDPMLPFAEVVGAARRLAAEAQAVTTFGRVRVDPNGTNAIPSRVDAWLDARGPEQSGVTRLVDDLQRFAEEAAAGHGVRLTVENDSFTPVVDFDASLSDRLRASLGAASIGAPTLPTAAGHDAGILASRVPTAMLFVRNPTGISHSPVEHAEAEDCVDGVEALTIVLRDLLVAPLEVVPAGATGTTTHHGGAGAGTGAGGSGS